MKYQIKLLTVAIITSILAACSSGGTKTETADAKNLKTVNFDQNYYTNKSSSSIAWEGYKPTGTHHGTVVINNGNLNIRNEKLVGGEFTIDMNAIVVDDLTDADKNAKLSGHLRSADFFDTETYPKASFVITDVKPIDGSRVDKSKEKGNIVPNQAITGNLTIKGITKSISFNAQVIINNGMFIAKTNQFFIDRAQWNIRYGSKSFFDDLKNNFINDEIGLEINVVASKSEDLSGKH